MEEKLAAETKLRQEYENCVNELTTTVEQLEEDLQQLGEQAQAEIDKHTTINKNLETKLTESQALLNRLISAVETLKAERSQRQIQIDSLTASNTALNAQLQTEKQSYEALVETNRVLNEQLTTTKERFEVSNQLSEAEIARLQQELTERNQEILNLREQLAARPELPPPPPPPIIPAEAAPEMNLELPPPQNQDDFGLQFPDEDENDHHEDGEMDDEDHPQPDAVEDHQVGFACL